jgi:hypothetical protein
VPDLKNNQHEFFEPSAQTLKRSIDSLIDSSLRLWLIILFFASSADIRDSLTGC